MIYEFIYSNFLKQNINIFIYFVIINLIIYPLETIFISKLFSELIDKTKSLKLRKFNLNKELKNLSIKNPNITSLMIIILTTLIFISLLDRIKSYLYGIFYPKLRGWIRTELFNQTLNKYNNDVKNIQIGKEVMRIEDITSIFKDFFNYTITIIVPIKFIIIIIITYLYFTDLKICLTFSLFVALMLLVSYIFFKKIKKNTFSRIEIYYDIGNNIDNSFTNISNILVNNKNKYEKIKNDIKNDKYKKICIKLEKQQGNLSFLLRLITGIQITMVIILSYYLMINKKIEMKQVTTIIIIMIYYLALINNNSYQLAMSADVYSQILFQKKYLNDILDNNKNQEKYESVEKLDIEFRNLYFKYNESDKYILKNFNYKINFGEKIAIMGKSGSGKSTLVKLLIKLYMPIKGEIMIGDKNLKYINSEFIRNNINYINQNTMLFDENIFYNIKYGIIDNKEEKIKFLSSNLEAPSPSNSTSSKLSPTPSFSDNKLIDEKIIDILKKYDLLSIYDKLENSLESMAGTKGLNLSLGMQKVTIIMRGIIRDSKIMIIDEPLAGLDEITKKKIIKLILNETKNKTLIIITHNKDLLPHMDKVLHLNKFQK